MIFELFVMLLGVIAFLCWFGYYSKIRTFAVVGMSILFILSSWIILYSYSGKTIDGLEYKSGYSVNDSASPTVITYNYTSYNDSTTLWIGFLLAIVSAVGIFLVAKGD